MLQMDNLEVYTLDSLLEHLKVDNIEEILTRLVATSRWGLFANEEEAILVDSTTFIIWLLQNGFNVQLPPDEELTQLEGRFVLLQLYDSPQTTTN